MRSPDLAHAALANQGGDFIGAEATAGANGHVRQILRQELACAANRGTAVEAARPTRFGPAAFGSGGRRSYQESLPGGRMPFIES